MQVYPAASLIHYIKEDIPIYFIDPKPSVNDTNFNNITVYAEKATVGVEKLWQVLHQ